MTCDPGVRTGCALPSGRMPRSTPQSNFSKAECRCPGAVPRLLESNHSRDDRLRVIASTLRGSLEGTWPEPLKNAPSERYIPRVPAKEPKREFKVGDKVRVNLHHGKIEDAVVRAVIQDADGIKLQVDVVGLDLTALIDTRQVVE